MTTMNYTYLGKTGLQVSRIGLGCISFGTPGWLGWDWILDEAAAEPFFRRAVELGINFFDTADSYSAGRSKEITGKWLKKYARRDEIVIATKVHFGPGDRPNQSGLSRKHIQQACEASLKRLGVETIGLNCPRFPNLWVTVSESGKVARGLEFTDRDFFHKTLATNVFIANSNSANDTAK